MTATYGEQRSELMKTVDRAVLDRVRDGIALLEEEYGPDWVEHIDLRKLDLADVNCCVLGQLFDDHKHETYVDEDGDEWPAEDGYTYACETIPALKDGSSKYGFDVDGETYYALNQVWKREIRELTST